MSIKNGLALGSGGARGLAHIGVLKQLEAQKINIHYIAGSSIGAMVGALYAANPNAAMVEEFFLAQCTWQKGLDLLDPSLTGGFLHGKKLEKLFVDFLDGKAFEQLEIPLTIIATDLLTGSEIRINSGLVSSAIRASISAIPLLAPVALDDWILADGGLSNPVPDNVVKEMGADFVYSVNLNTLAFKSEPLNSNSLPAVLLRSINVLQFHLSSKSTNDTDSLIEPQFDKDIIVGFDDFFNKTFVTDCIVKGEEAAKLVLNSNT